MIESLSDAHHGWSRDSHCRPSILVPRARDGHRSALSCFLVGRHAVAGGALEELIQQLLQLQLVVVFGHAGSKPPNPDKTDTVTWSLYWSADRQMDFILCSH